MPVQSRILRTVRADVAAVVFLSLGVAVFEDWKEVSGAHNCLCALQHPVSVVRRGLQHCQLLLVPWLHALQLACMSMCLDRGRPGEH